MNKRNSNIELLRIISIFLILMHHFALHGYIMDGLKNNYIINIFVLGGKLGVNLFIIISAYYMYKSKFTIKKALRIIGEVLFYTIGMLILFKFVIDSDNVINIKSVLESLFPITYETYWFITCYFILMIIAPFLNKFIDKIEKRDCKILLICLIGIWSIYKFLTKGKLAYSDFGWFVTLYLIAIYMNKYQIIKKYDIKKYIVLIIFNLIFIINFSILFTYLGNKTNIAFLYKGPIYISSMTNIMVLTLSIAIFSTFLSFEVWESHVINNLASASLGVYLIHDNFLMRGFLWKNIVKCSELIKYDFFIIKSIVILIIIYITCTFIDLIRQMTFEKIYLKFINYCIEKLKENKNIIKVKKDFIEFIES